MNLPQIILPKFKTNLISTDKTITFRPYTVKEQEVLAIAKAGENKNEIISSVVDLINRCCEEVDDASKLPIFDFEFLFLKLKTISSGEIIELLVPHTDQSQCEFLEKVVIDLNNIKIKTNPEHTKDIKIDDNVGVMMKYPNFEDVISKTAIDLYIDCIDYIYDSDSIYKDNSKEELREWIQGLDQFTFNKIVNFFRTFPKVYLEITWTCSKCGKTETRIEEGIESFF
jgi:hypothetical protein